MYIYVNLLITTTVSSPFYSEKLRANNFAEIKQYRHKQW